MAYATASDLASFLQVPSVDTATADLFLQLVSDEMDDWAGQTLGQQNVSGLLLDGTGAAELVLPGYPVNSIASIEVLATDGTWTLLVDGVDYAWSASGVVRRRWPEMNPATQVLPAWPVLPASVRAAYNRGTGVVKGSIKGVCLAVTARMMTNPAGLLAEQIGGMQLRYAAKTGGVEFTPIEQRILERVSDPVMA